MNCTNARELMSEHIDGLLDQDRAAQLLAHLDQCPACRGELAALEKAVRLVRSLKPVEAPAGMAQGVRARLETAGKPRRSFRPIKMFYPALALAAGLVLVVGAVTYFLLEQGRPEAGFTVASVKQKTAEEVVADKVDTAKPAVPTVAGEMTGAHSAEKDGRIWSGGDEKMKQEETLARKKVGRIAAESAAEPGSDSLAMCAPQPAQARGGALREEALVAGAAGQAAPAGAMPPAADKSAAKSMTAGPRFVNLAITTTNRTEVEKVLFAFNGILFLLDQKRFKGGLKPQFRTAPGYELKGVTPEKAGDVFLLNIPAASLSDLRTQLKTCGTVLPTGTGPEKSDDVAAADSASAGRLIVYVTIADP